MNGVSWQDFVYTQLLVLSINYVSSYKVIKSLNVRDVKHKTIYEKKE